MADEKLTALTALDAFATGDLLYTVDNPGGTPLSKKATIDQAKTFIVGAGSVSIASGKTLTGSNTLTLAGTDGTTMTFPATSGTVATLNTAQTFTALQTLNRSGEQLALGSAGANSGVMSFAGSTSGKVTMQAAAAAGTYTLTLPVNDGDSGQFLQTDGSGVTSWATASGGSGSPGGSDTQIQYNNAGAFAGASGITTNGTNLTLGSASQLLWSTDLILTRRGAANLRLGAADAAGSAIAVNSVASNQLTLASNHGLTNGAAVQVTFTAGGAVPAGTAVNTTYYARSISAAVLELYATYDQATAASGTTGRVSVTTAGTTAFINRAAPFQTLSVQSFTGTDIPGQPFVITGSQGTGTGAGGSLIFQVAPAGSSGSAQNALAMQFQVNGSGGVTGQDGATANTLALRNGTAAQRFNVYNTWTSSTNYETFKIDWITTANTVLVGTEKGSGGGTARALAFQTDGTTRLTIGTTGFNTVFSQTVQLNGARGVDINGNVATIGYNGIGLSDSLSFTIGYRNGYPVDSATGTISIAGNSAYSLASSNITGGNITLSAGNGASGSAGVANGGNILLDGGQGYGTGVTGRLVIGSTRATLTAFGGITSSFPALKRSSTTLQVRLADDSANAPLESASVKTDAPAGGTSGTWKLGVAATVSPTSPNRTIEVDIGGTIYYIAAKTTND
jgi:hypothetical protein